MTVPVIVAVLWTVGCVAAGVFWGVHYSESHETHTCTGCYANEIETCGELCVDCTFDAEQATGNAQPVVDEARRKKFGPS